MKLLVEIGGQVVPLDACNWVLWGPCGCPLGVTVGRLSPTEDDAWKKFLPVKRVRNRRQDQGFRLELVTHEKWHGEIVDLMRDTCNHKIDRRRHGISSTYRNGCRCEPCCAAHTVRCSQERLARTERPTAEIPHGASGYRNWGCRCDTCKAAGSAVNAATRARRLARQNGGARP